MYKAVVVDDERIVIEGLKKLIKWEKFGFELAGCYTDGIEASLKIKEIKPDLVISDIRMPGIDGLSMIEELKKDLPYTVFLIISGYTDFQYARRALNLSVADYIDKPITIEKMSSVLERMKGICDENIAKKESINKLQNINKTTLEKAILEIIYNDDNFNNWFMRLEEEQKKEFNKTASVCVVSGFVKNYSFSCDDSIKSIFEKYFIARTFTYITIKKGENFTSVILCMDGSIKNAGIYKLVEKCKVICADNDIYMVLGASQIYNSIGKLRAAYLQSVKALRYALFKAADNLYIYDSDTYNNHLPAIKKFNQETIFQNIRILDKDSAIRELEKYLSLLIENELTPDVLSQECLKLIYKAMDEAKCTGYDIEYQAVNGMYIHEEIQLCKSYSDITKWTVSAFKQIIENMLNICGDKVYKPITKIKEYLQRNFQKDISLNDVAKEVGFNAAYLSILFKEEMGTSFVKYLTGLRLDYAKRLLEEGYKVVDVSKKSGFNNYRYFCDTFKKYNGMTPNEYKLSGYKFQNTNKASSRK